MIIRECQKRHLPRQFRNKSEQIHVSRGNLFLFRLIEQFYILILRHHFVILHFIQIILLNNLQKHVQRDLRDIQLILRVLRLFLIRRRDQQRVVVFNQLLFLLRAADRDVQILEHFRLQQLFVLVFLVLLDRPLIGFIHLFDLLFLALRTPYHYKNPNYPSIPHKSPAFSARFGSPTNHTSILAEFSVCTRAKTKTPPQNLPKYPRPFSPLRTASTPPK